MNLPPRGSPTPSTVIQLSRDPRPARPPLRGLSAAAFGLLAACTSPQVRSDFDPSFEFEGVRSFEWDRQAAEPHPTVPEVSPLDLGRFESAVQAAMTARGYLATPPGDVVLRAGLTSEEEYRSFVTGGGFGYGWGPGFYGPGFYGPGRFGFGPNVMVTRRTRAIFFLDVFARGGEQLVWRGSATVPVSWFDHPDPARRQRRIDEVASDLLDRFPPQ